MPETPLQKMLSRCPDAKLQPNGWYAACCPLHDDKHPSFGFHETPSGAISFNCKVCGDAGKPAILSRLSLTFADLSVETKSNGKPQLIPYDYVSAGGKLLYQSVREPTPPKKAGGKPGKKFFFRRPDGTGGWIMNMQGIQRVIYRLPEVMAAKKTGKTVWIAEGEKCCDALVRLGLIATTNAGGAGNWRSAYAETLVDCHVVILPDNDDPGKSHAERVRDSLLGKSASVRVLMLPDLPEDGGDVVDWLRAGGTRAELEQLAAAAAPESTEPKALEVPEIHFSLDDLGNARRLIARHGHEIRFCAVWDCWLVWDGRRWSPDDTQAIKRHAIETAESILGEAKGIANPDVYRAITKHAGSSRSSNSLAAMLRVAQALSEVAVRPDYFDQEAWLITCLNGTLDLCTGTLLPHNPDHHITKLAAVNYVPGARFPLWEDLLDKVTSGDLEVREYLQKAAGYSLPGSTREEKIFILVSEGGGGKTTFLETIATAMGDYATSAEHGTFLRRGTGGGHSEDVAALVGARMVLATELGKGRLAEEFVKRITGGDTMRASRKHGHSFTFRPEFTLWMASQFGPSADGEDTGMWRRLRKIPWTPIRNGDPSVKEILLHDQAAREAAFAWQVEGCRLYLRDGLGDPPAVASATEAYRQENNSLAEYCADYSVFGKWQWVRSDELRRDYEQWCRGMGYQPISGRQWADGLRKAGCSPKSVRIKGHLYRGWQGIGMRGDAPTGEDGPGELPLDQAAPASEVIVGDPSLEAEEDNYPWE